MQSNANRIRTILKKAKILLLISGALIIVLNVTDINWVSTLVSGIWVAATMSWWLFDNFLWKNKNINKVLKFSKTIYCPVIDGRWEGILTRDGKEHQFVVEIKQTYTTISCATYSKHSYSYSACAELLYDEQNKLFSFVYLWKGKTQKSPDGHDEPSNYFNGTTILTISDDCKKMSGSYFTDRSPEQTKGTITLTYRQNKLKSAL